MRSSPRLICGVLFAHGALLFGPTVACADIGYQWVSVGNPGNANNSTGRGAVSYTYDIGQFDVTLTQYTAFLNAVANTDPYGLDNTNLATFLEVAGIARNGSAGGYTYSVIGDGQRPATYISWLDAARFANWMNNGQPTGLGEVAASTEGGAYTLNGDTTSGLETKNANATYWLPTDAEWYKAAYYDPTLNGGAGRYWTYATRSNSEPGNVVGSGANEANFWNGVYSVTQSSSLNNSQNYLTDVGAFTNSASYYGLFDATGDVSQWGDAERAPFGTEWRGWDGGSWIGGGPTKRHPWRTLARAAQIRRWAPNLMAFVSSPSLSPAALRCWPSELARSLVGVVGGARRRPPRFATRPPRAKPVPRSFRTFRSATSRGRWCALRWLIFKVKCGSALI